VKRSSPTGRIRFIAMSFLVLCNQYGLPMAARSLGEFQGVSEAPVSHVILVERATRKFAQRTAARRVELKMGLRLRCFSVTGRKEHAPSSRLGAGHFELNHRQVIPVTQHCMWFGCSCDVPEEVLPVFFL